MAPDGDGGGGGFVCVTGGSGFIGSWLVRLLLGRGYTVHATVKNLHDEGETKHLQAMDGAGARLRLRPRRLPPRVPYDTGGRRSRGNDSGSITTPVVRCIINPIIVARKELLEPAVKGTLNVLRAARDCGVGRVVLMSSQAAMVPNPNWPEDKVIDEDCWADVELLKKLQIWYSVSKTLAEKAAWDFAATEGLQVAVLNPGMVLGPMLTPSVNVSLQLLLQLLRGERLDHLDKIYVGCVDVRDVADSLMMLYENPAAQGRHLCIESIERLVDFTKKIADLYPEYPVQRTLEDKQGWVARGKDPSKKLIELGSPFTPFDKTIRDTMDAAGDSGGARGGLVCVTGGSGFIGSWLVRLLLDRGYTVHATVKNLQDEGETKHLQALDGAGTRLRLFQMDLLDPASSMRPAIDGARGKELLEPALKGTLSVLRAAKDCGVGRVVLMSSKSAMLPNPAWPADKAIVEDDCWADVELLKKRQLWYNVSKTLAEKAAWDFAEKEGLQLVVLNPGTTLGPFFTPSVNTSLNILLQLLRGQELELDAVYTGWVDVRDVAQSAIVLYENPSAQGRHLCLAAMERLVDFTDKIADMYPEFPVQRTKEDKQGWLMRAEDPSKKLIELGVRFAPFGQTIRETVDCFRSKGLI
ncbi:hypothetical protein U9M48_017297 [Paspalum notatum var. saurae]|uniref:NAD-dependent epimerase/dehydratase domain-containing protein n=1 Tax=Paspalum notatum var. saurae TaxID=547442 RepID=A0AAQ3TB77_PASNO